MKIKYELVDTCDKARLGILHTNHGSFETPMFMPVGTQATVKTLSPEELKSVGSAIILSNTYHLWLRPTEDIVAAAGGLHKFMNYDGPILTDSGGFQVFSLAKNKKKDIVEEGVHFKSHLDGRKLFLTPELSIEIQNKLDSDIAMSFDEEYSDLREYSAKETVKMNFDGYSIGGTSVGEDKVTMYKMIDDAIKYLPSDKPRYLMGVGDPIDIIEGVMRGVDMFDCVLPTRLARHGNAFTRMGKINIKNLNRLKEYKFKV